MAQKERGRTLPGDRAPHRWRHEDQQPAVVQVQVDVGAVVNLTPLRQEAADLDPPANGVVHSHRVGSVQRWQLAQGKQAKLPNLPDVGQDAVPPRLHKGLYLDHVAQPERRRASPRNRAPHPRTRWRTPGCSAVLGSRQTAPPWGKLCAGRPGWET